MTIDNIGVIEAESSRVVDALTANGSGRIPWSDTWTVSTCARHIGGAHHVVAQVVDDRPAGDFSMFSGLEMPDGDDPALADWIAGGTSALVRALRACEPEAECWSWWPDGRTAAFWQRRMAQETLVHRWDTELGAGVDGAPMDPAVAADGIDEYLDVFAGVTRMLHAAPAGPSIHVHCTDTDGEWLIALPAAGERVVTREHAKGDAALRGPAEGLLLTAWGRLDPAAAGVEVVGDEAVVARWAELFPPM
jgi:uncharacterized protein (TIGR03083 family)